MPQIFVAHGKLDGVDIIIAGLNFAFMGGSMGVAVGEAYGGLDRRSNASP